ncbi:serine/threonine-protein kinase haspin-like isoform X2 [Haemaphysalis longicornis]
MVALLSAPAAACCRAKCIRDTYPGVLVENQKAVRGTRPLGFVMCDSEPFLLVEYAVGGVRLSDVMIESVDQVHSIVAQVILAVAIAEEAMQFEHRDLQMDNVLVKMTSNETAVFIYNKKRIVLHTRGVVACVIDFNLSRATIDGRPIYYDPSKHFTTDFLEERSCMGFDTMRGALR